MYIALEISVEFLSRQKNSDINSQIEKKRHSTTQIVPLVPERNFEKPALSL